MTAPPFTWPCRYGVRPARVPWWRWTDRLLGRWAVETHHNLVIDVNGFVSLQGWGGFVGRTVSVGRAVDLVHARPKPSRVQLRTPAGDVWTFQLQDASPDAARDAADLLLLTLGRFGSRYGLGTR